MLFHRKSFWWAIGWGLILETLAIVSPFGEVFGLRQYSNAVLLAYFAHIFYGWPLGVICEDRKPNPESRWSQIWDKQQVLIIVALTLLVGTWFVLVRPAGDGSVPESVINVGTNRILPTWADMAQGSSLTINNPNESKIEIRVRSPSPSGHVVTEYSILPDQSMNLIVNESGIYQLDCSTHPQWRSIFWSVNLDGDYRTRR